MADWNSKNESNGDYRSVDSRAISALVDRAKQGDTDAFGEIYRLHREALFRFARYRLGRRAAEDAVGDVFLRALAGLPKYKETGAPFVSWLYGIARHVVSDVGAAERRVEPRDNFPDRADIVGLSATDHIALYEAIGRLPEKQRQVIELKFLIGLTNEEVGAALGKSPGAVNAQQWRALEALKRHLERQ
ncbi:MAG: RNA polymerase sigma factor [Actinomycetota bacterium]